MTLAQTPAVRYHQGWRYDFDADRPAGAKWVATWRGQTVTAVSENCLKTAIDNHLEKEAA